MERFSTLTRRMMAAAAVLLLAAVVSSPAWADHFYTSYFDVASNLKTTAGGYGGFGASGGVGDALLRVVNPTHIDTIQNGTICAMIYVFNDDEEIQECCGCPVTPDGLRTISVTNSLLGNLTGNPGFSNYNLAAGVIDIVPSQLNWRPPTNNPGLAPPRGVNETSVGDCSSGACGCDPSGGGTRPSGGSNSTAVTGEGELKAWLNHTEGMYTSNSTSTSPTCGPAGNLTCSTSVAEFAGAYLDSTHLTDLEDSCGVILLTGGSGAGVCTCGAGDTHSAFKPKS